MQEGVHRLEAAAVGHQQVGPYVMIGRKRPIETRSVRKGQVPGPGEQRGFIKVQMVLARSRRCLKWFEVFS